MRKLGIAAAILAAALVFSVASAWAMSHGGGGMKVYWAGVMFGPFNIQAVIPSYPEARDIMFPANMYIIDHPKGLVLYDTGGQRRGL